MPASPLTGLTLANTPHFSVIGHNPMPDETRVAQLTGLLEKRYRSIGKFTGISIPVERITIHVYSSGESKGMLTGDTRPASADNQGQLYLVLNETYDGYELALPYRLMLEKLWGPPAREELAQGLAVFFTEHWQRMGYRYWAGRLYASGNYLTLNQLLDTSRAPFQSPLVRECLLGALTEWMVSQAGIETVEKLYKQGGFEAFNTRLFEKSWALWLESLSKLYGSVKTSTSKLPEKLLGFNFAHEGYRIFNGYISEAAANSLQQLKETGANAVTVIPYTFMPEPTQPFAFPFASGAGSENDESLVHVMDHAQRLGLRVMVKPQIWLHGNWPGDIRMKTPEDWELFFEHYYQWILHYAFLSEIRGAEVFCIGTEMSETTRLRPEQWKWLIGKIRGLYSGALTYCANWYREFESVSFWKELDYAGISCYYPLSASEQASRTELEEGMRAIAGTLASVSRESGRKVLLAEIGYRSIPHPWVLPHDYDRNATGNQQDQALCYDLAMQNLAAADWCAGIFWWKWPAYMPYRMNDQTGFSPLNKQAEKVLENWFEHLEAQ